MDLKKEQLIDGICTLVKNQDFEQVINIILQQMDEIQLQRLIQCLVDKDFLKKEAVWSNPKRFTTTTPMIKKGN